MSNFRHFLDLKHVLYLIINISVPTLCCECYTPIKDRNYIITQITEPGLLFESPQWSSEENVLYWVDKYGQQLYRLDPETNDLTTRDIGFGPTALIVPVKDAPGIVLVGVRAGLYLLKWGAPGGDFALRPVTAVDFGKPDNIINDGKVDANGRLWFGTQPNVTGPNADVIPDQATFYSLTYENFQYPETKIKPVSLSNGIAWSLDNKKMFYNDSPTKKIMQYDFELRTGEIANKKILFDFVENDILGIPDGMTIDVDGNLWVASVRAKKVLKISSVTGQLLDQVSLPVTQVTSCIWGGKDYKTLYVTTSRRFDENPTPQSGALFAITNTGTSGRPEPLFNFPGAANY